MGENEHVNIDAQLEALMSGPLAVHTRFLSHASMMECLEWAYERGAEIIHLKYDDAGNFDSLTTSREFLQETIEWRKDQGLTNDGEETEGAHLVLKTHEDAMFFKLRWG